MAVVNKLLGSWKDAYTVRRVFGEAVEKGDLTVIPVAMVAGGGAGGTGEPAEAGAGEAEGGAFAGVARPAGVYVVKADGVEWHPAIDVTLLGMAGMLLAALITVVVGGAIKKRRRR